MVQVLLDHKADIEATDSFGRSALHAAAENGQDSTVRFLVEKGADLTAETIFGDTPLELAKAKGHNDVVQYLESAVQTYSGTTPATADTPLLAAVKKGADDTVKRLLEDDGSDPNEKDEEGRTLLHHSTARKHTSITELLMSKGADSNAKDTLQMTPLHYACADDRYSIAVVTVLLEGGANATIKHDVLGTPLDIATKDGKTELLQVLKSATQKPRIVIYQGSAVSKAHKKVVEAFRVVSNSRTPGSSAPEKAVKAPKAEATEDTTSAFLAKFCEFTDDMHPAVVLEQLWPLISCTPELQLYYTAASVAYKQGRINEIERNKLMKKGLNVAVKTAVNRDSIVVFKLALEHAFAHGYITRAEQLGLDNDAEVNRMSEAPFVKDMESCIKANTMNIARMNERLDAHAKAINENRQGILHINSKLDAHAQAIERNANNIRATSNALNDFKRAYKHQKKVESTVKILKFAVNVVSLGVGGELVDIGAGMIEGVTNVGSIFDHIIDLSDVEALSGLVNSMGSALSQVPFDPVEILTSESVTAFVGDQFYDTVGGMGVNMYEKVQMRQLKALEGLTIAAVACSVTTFDVVEAETRAPSFSAVPPPSPIPNLDPSTGAPKSLSDFLEGNQLKNTKNELTKHGYKTVRALKRTAEGQGDEKSFNAHMRSQGVRLSAGDFAELYAALMEI